MLKQCYYKNTTKYWLSVMLKENWQAHSPWILHSAIFYGTDVITDKYLMVLKRISDCFTELISFEAWHCMGFFLLK